MYDTLNLNLPFKGGSRLNEIDVILCSLSKAKQVIKLETGEIACTKGKLNNLYVNVYNSGIWINGSLCKYYLGNNLQTLDREKTKLAIELLSDSLHLPIANAKVTKLHVAHNLLMNHPVKDYYPCLGDLSNYTMATYENTRYYTSKNKEIAIYDKLLELKEKCVSIPCSYIDKNILRYELRFERRINEIFNMPQVTAQHLYDEHFYQDRLNDWKHAYHTINKIKQYLFKPEALCSPKDLEKILCLKGIEALGGQQAVFQMIDQAQNLKAFNNRMKVSRLKSRLKLIANTPDSVFESEAIQELDYKINNICG